MFKKKPTTVSGVYQESVAQIKAIKDAELQKLEVLKTSQAKRDEEYAIDSAANAEESTRAESEAKLADSVMDRFADLFGIS